MKILVKYLPLLLLGFFSLLMVNITLPYFSFNDKTSFLQIKQWVINNNLWKSAFYIHVFSSCFCLLAGFTQFSRGILQYNTTIHRSMGFLYILTVLLLSGPSGLIMSFYANGGFLSQVAFSLLSIFWLFFTYRAFINVRNSNYSEHQKNMIRSYALTMSAITLRAWKFGIVYAFRPQPMDAYMIVAWLGWVPNLVFAELYIKYKLSNKSKYI